MKTTGCESAQNCLGKHPRAGAGTPVIFATATETRGTSGTRGRVAAVCREYLPAHLCIVGGAGAVGSATAAALLTQGIAAHLSLVDVNTPLLTAHVMDLRLVRSRRGTVAAAPLPVAAEADLVVLTASVPHRDGMARADFLGSNAAILRETLDVLPSGWGGTLLIATNPVDQLCMLARRVLSPEATVLGYTLNDSLRLAQSIALEIGCHPSKVGAWAIGEHGPHTVPLFDRVTLDGRPLELAESQQKRATDRTKDWYDVWQRLGTGRTSTWASGSGLTALARALLSPTRTLLPASLPLSGEYGLTGVSLGVPALVGRGGAEIVEWQLTAGQSRALRAAAEAVTGSMTEPA
ncbi:malate dehydrogenase [Streptomyces griseoviridis]